MTLEPVILNELQLKSTVIQDKIDTQTQTLVADNVIKRDEIKAHTEQVAELTNTNIVAARDDIKSHVTTEADRVIENSSGGSSSSVMIGQGILLPEAGLSVTHSSMKFLLSGTKIVNPPSGLEGITSPYLGQLDYTTFDGSAVFRSGYFSDELKIVAGDAGSYFISKDGGEFIRHSPNGTNRFRGVTVFDGVVHLCGDNGYYATSTDGENFSSVDLGFGSAIIFGVLCNEQLTVVFGSHRFAYKRAGDEQFTVIVLNGVWLTGHIQGNKVILGRSGDKRVVYTDDGFLTHTLLDLTPTVPYNAPCRGVQFTENNVYLVMGDTHSGIRLFKLNKDLEVENESILTIPENATPFVSGFIFNRSIFCVMSGKSTPDSPSLCEYSPVTLSLVNAVALTGFTTASVQGIENYGDKVVALGFDATATSAKAAGFDQYQPSLYMRYE